MNDFDRGFLLGFFCGQGSFGGDGKQGHIILRMHAVHLPLMERLRELLTGSKINGPYTNGVKLYYQWSLRGNGLEALVSSRLLEELAEIDIDSHRRYRGMVDRYFKKLDKIQ
jgi:hypothetical protein